MVGGVGACGHAARLRNAEAGELLRGVVVDACIAVGRIQLRRGLRGADHEHVEHGVRRCGRCLLLKGEAIAWSK